MVNEATDVARANLKHKQNHKADRTACKHRPSAQPWPPNNTGVKASPLYNLPSMYNVLQDAVCEVEQELNHAPLQRVEDCAHQQHRSAEKLLRSSQYGGNLSPVQDILLHSARQNDKANNKETTFITQPELHFLTSDQHVNKSCSASQSRQQHSQVTQHKTLPQAKTAIGQGEIRLIPNAPNINPAGRAVHPLFLAGTLLNGLPTSASHHITGERPKRSSKACTANPQPQDWTTDDLVTNCIRPALGATRVSYAQALACGAVEVSWCTDGRFKSNIVPQLPSSPTKHSGKSTASPSQTQRGMPTKSHLERNNSHNNSAYIRIPLSANAKLNGGNVENPIIPGQQKDNSWEVPVPKDLEGKSVYGPATYYVIHAWRDTDWTQLVTAILRHYLRLPEVASSGGTRFVPVYYWLDVFAVPQHERPCPEFKRPEPVLRSIMSSCQAVLLAAQPWDAPAVLSRAWCLFELFLTREVGQELQALLLDEPASGSTSSSISLNRFLSDSTAPENDCLVGDKAYPIVAVSIIDQVLQSLSMNTAGARVAVDQAMLNEALGDIRDFDDGTRKYIRTHLLAALLTACLRRAENDCWRSALCLINEGAFLQWPTPTLAVDCGSPAGSADEAAAFLGAALQTCSPHVLTAWGLSHSSNPIQELVFLPPAERRHPCMTTQTSCKPLQYASTLAESTVADQLHSCKSRNPATHTGVVHCSQDAIDRSLARTAVQNQSPRRRSSKGQYAECLLSPAGVVNLSQGLIGNIHLTRLVLSSHPIGDAGIESLVEALTSQPTALQQLEIRNCDLGGEAGESLAELLGDVHTCQLRQLDIGNNPGLGSKGIHALSQGLIYNKHLRVLKLDGCEAGTDAVTALVSALTQQLDNCAGLGNEDAQQQQTSTPQDSQDMPTGTGIRCLDLQNNGIGVQAGLAIAQHISHPLCKLNQLYLGYNLLETLGVLPMLNALKANTSLKVLQLRANHLALEVGATLGDALSANSHSMCHAVINNRVQDSRGLPYRMSDTQSASCQHGCFSARSDRGRSMSVKPISNNGLYDTSGHAHPLVHLNLGENPMLGDVGVELLAEGLKKAGSKCQLKVLILDDVGCGTPGVTSLAHAIACTATASTSNVPTPSSGLPADHPMARESREVRTSNKVQRHMSEMPACESGQGLQHIDLSNNPLGKEGAISLAGALPHAVGLETLILRNCMMDVDGKLALLTALQLNGSTLKLLNMRNNGQDPATYIPNSSAPGFDGSRSLHLCTYEMTLAQSLTLARQLTSETGMVVDMTNDQ